MKRVNYIIPVLVLLILIAPMSAQENASEDAGVTPDNGFLWGMERAMESTSLAFTFNETKKAQKSLEYANERAAEAQKMAEENKSEASEKAMKNWGKNMQKTNERMKGLEEKNQTRNAGKIREGMQNAEGTLERVRNRIMNDDNPHNDNALQGLDKALGNVRGNMSDVKGSGERGTGRDEAGKEDSTPGSGGGEKTGEEEIIPNTTEEKGKFSLMVSDAPADIEDFDSLIVNFSEARVFERNTNNSEDNEDDENSEDNETLEVNESEEEYEENTVVVDEEDMENMNINNTNENNETTNNTETEQEQNEEQEKNQVKERKGFSIIELDGEEVDLTQVVGEKAEEIASVNLSEGTYNKIELHVQSVTGIVDDKEVEVMVPSNKLQIVKPFTISEEEPLDFVFDINIVKKGPNGYNLLPVISESGAVGKDIDKIEKVNKTTEKARNNNSMDENISA